MSHAVFILAWKTGCVQVLVTVATGYQPVVEFLSAGNCLDLLAISSRTPVFIWWRRHGGCICLPKHAVQSQCSFIFAPFDDVIHRKQLWSSRCRDIQLAVPHSTIRSLRLQIGIWSKDTPTPGSNYISLPFDIQTVIKFGDEFDQNQNRRSHQLHAAQKFARSTQERVETWLTHNNNWLFQFGMIESLFVYMNFAW